MAGKFLTTKPPGKAGEEFYPDNYRVCTMAASLAFLLVLLPLSQLLCSGVAWNLVSVSIHL